MRATVVGAGSTYTPELVDGLLRRGVPLTELRVSATTSLQRAVTGARLVFSQFRVGGQAARHGDEELGRRWGIVGQETTGVGGFVKGLRTSRGSATSTRLTAAFQVSLPGVRVRRLGRPLVDGALLLARGLSTTR